jgi:hypothetical protein
MLERMRRKSCATRFIDEKTRDAPGRVRSAASAFTPTVRKAAAFSGAADKGSRSSTRWRSRQGLKPRSCSAGSRGIVGERSHVAETVTDAELSLQVSGLRVSFEEPGEHRLIPLKGRAGCDSIGVFGCANAPTADPERLQAGVTIFGRFRIRRGVLYDSHLRIGHRERSHVTLPVEMELARPGDLELDVARGGGP